MHTAVAYETSRASGEQTGARSTRCVAPGNQYALDLRGLYGLRLGSHASGAQALGYLVALAFFELDVVLGCSSHRAAGRRPSHRYLPAAAFAVAAVPILHSLVDFSLQMPAIAFVVSAVLGLGWAQAFGRRERSRGAYTPWEQANDVLSKAMCGIAGIHAYLGVAPPVKRADGIATARMQLDDPKARIAGTLDGCNECP